MKRLYPELHGANPLARSRRIEEGDIQEYLQFGPSFFVNRGEVGDLKMDLSSRIKRILDVFIERKGIRTVVSRGPLAATQRFMDWPNLYTTLRSSETMSARVGAQDMGSRIPLFWITIRQLLLTAIQRGSRVAGQNVSDLSDAEYGGGSTGEQAKSVPYSGFRQTTLDPGGDCHKQPIVKVNAAQLQSILSSDVCFVVSSNMSFRELNCSKKGLRNSTTIVLQTTAQRAIADPATFYKNKKVFRPCGSQFGVPKPNSSAIYSWNSTSRVFEPVHIRDEISLSTRVRVSPLWNLLSRFREHPVAKKLSPQQAWTTTDTRRHTNPRWAPDTNNQSFDANWDEPWVFTNSNPKCGNTSHGKFPRKDWYNNPRKNEMCLAQVNTFAQNSPGCVSEIANFFNLCQIDEFKSFCFVLDSIRAELRQVNAQANQYTRSYRNLYMPSRYLTQDSMYGWSAVVETYNTIDPEMTANVATCPGISQMRLNIDYKENQDCPGTWIFKISEFLERIRGIVTDIVTIIVLMQTLAVDALLFFLAVLGNDKELQKEKSNEMLATIKSIVVKMLSYYKEMIRLIWDIISTQDGVFKSVSDLIRKLCNFAKDILNKIVGVLISIFEKIDPLNVGNADERIVNDLENFRDKVLSWNCNFIEPRDDSNRPDAQKMHASTCWIQQAGFSMPSDVLGGLAGEFSCGPTSFCLKEVLSTEPAELCIRCNEYLENSEVRQIRGYTCDLATKQCVCGQADLQATSCLISEDCSKQGAVCDVKSSFYMNSFSSQLCADTVGRSYCMKPSVNSGTGTCVTYEGSASSIFPTCTITGDDSMKFIISSNLCLGISENIPDLQNGVLLLDTFMFPCSDLQGFKARDFKLACVPIILASPYQQIMKSFLTHNIRSDNSPLRRRLLDKHEFDTPEASHMLSDFVRLSAERIPSIRGLCGLSLQTWVQQDRNTHEEKTPFTTPRDERLSDYEMDFTVSLCSRIWWGVNFTLTGTQFRDTDFMEIRTGILKVAYNPQILSYAILTRTPHAVSVLVRDWLQDDSIFDSILGFLRGPMHAMDDFMFSCMLRLDRVYSPSAYFVHDSTARVGETWNRASLQNSSEAHQTTTKHNARRHLLAEGVGYERLIVSSDNITQPNSTSSDTEAQSPGREAGRTEMPIIVPFFDTTRFQDIFSDVDARNSRVDADLDQIRSETFSSAFGSADGASCMLSFGTVQNKIIMNFAKVLAKDGWTVKRPCTPRQLSDFADLVPECPLFTAPFTRAYQNTITISAYYAYLFQSGCLQNMSISCLRSADFAEAGIIQALPRLSQRVKFQTSTEEDVYKEKDQISYYILRFFYAVTDLVSFNRASIMNSVMAFASMDALYNDDIHDEMVRQNEYSLGRLLKDYFTCGLKDTISCGKKNTSLLPAFVAMFLVILVVHLTLPIPSVLSFYLWTVGLTSGVVYLSYNFSPLCMPRIPTCLGSGLYELSIQIIPMRINIPRSLYHHDKCNGDLSVKTEFLATFSQSSCGKSCIDKPFEMTDVLSVVIAIETWVRFGQASFTGGLLEQVGFFFSDADMQSYRDLITNYAREIRLDQNDFVTGFVFCIFFNFYKLIGLFIILTIVLPFLCGLLFSIITFIVVLIVKYALFCYGNDVNTQLH